MVSRSLGATCRPCESVGPDENQSPGTHRARFRVLGAANHRSYPSFLGWHMQSGKSRGYGTALFPPWPSPLDLQLDWVEERDEGMTCLFLNGGGKRHSELLTYHLRAVQTE